MSRSCATQCVSQHVSLRGLGEPEPSEDALMQAEQVGGRPASPGTSLDSAQHVRGGEGGQAVLCVWMGNVTVWDREGTVAKPHIQHYEPGHQKAKGQTTGGDRENYLCLQKQKVLETLNIFY